MIESKVIEKFMEDNGLEPYDAFDVDGEFKQYNPLYFNENLEVRSMELDSRNLDFFGGKACLYRLLTGKDHVEVVAEEKKNFICKVKNLICKVYVMSDEELDYLKKACALTSFVASDKPTKIDCKKLHEYLVTGERS